MSPGVSPGSDGASVTTDNETTAGVYVYMYICTCPREQRWKCICTEKQ